MGKIFDPQNPDQGPEPRTAEVVVSELADLYLEVAGDIIFEVRELSRDEMRAILALQETLLMAALCEALGTETDPDLVVRLLIIMTGCLEPKLDGVLAIRLTRDFRPILHRLSDKILELSAQSAGFDDLASMPKVH